MKQAGKIRLLTDDALALKRARELLVPYFGGERLTLYVPMAVASERAERNARIWQALAAGQSVQQVSQAEDVTERWVRALARRACNK